MVSDDRAQLLLVGSVALALTILGLTVLVNSVLFTENLESGQTIEDINDIDKYEYQVRRDGGSLVLRVNHADRLRSRSGLRDAVAEEVDRLGTLLAESYALSGGSVSLRYDRATENGTRIVQAADGYFNTSADGFDQNEWRPIENTQRVGWFKLNINATGVDTDPFVVEFTNGSASREVEISSAGLADTANISISVTADSPSGSPTTRSAECDPAGTRVLLDIRSGESYTSECSFPSLADFEGPYKQVTFRRGARMYGRYAIVVNGTDSGAGDVRDRFAYTCSRGRIQVPPNEPCATPIVWTAGFDATFSSDSVSYDKQINSTIYTGD